MTASEIANYINTEAQTLFRHPDGWPSMERHDLPGTQRNLLFVPCPGKLPEELIKAMRLSYEANVKKIVHRILDGTLELDKIVRAAIIRELRGY